MIFPDTVRLIFISCSFLLCALLIFMLIFTYRRKNQYRYYILFPVLTGILSSIAYCLFLCAKDHNLAVLFDSLFFIGTDWLAISMFHFGVSYTGILKKQSIPLHILFSALGLIDTASLLVNNYTYHMFDLVFKESEVVSWFWANKFNFFHYLHLGFCYAVIIVTFICFQIAIIKSPKLYKQKYSGIIEIYFIVIFINMLCYSINIPFDFSVLMYPILAAFICYYSTYAFPHTLLVKSLMSVNETIDDAVLYFDEFGECLYANRIAKIIFSENEEFKPILAEEFCISVLKNKEDFKNKIESFVIDNTLRRFRIEISKQIIKNEEVGTFIKLIDITVVQNAIERDHFMAIHDELTGLLNRTGYLEAVDAYIQKYGLEDMIMFTSNIKDFKLINDMFGEKTGDDILLHQSQIIVQNMHKHTIAGRTGDDKFSIFTKKEYGAEEVLEKYIFHFRKVSEKIVYQLYVHAGVCIPDGSKETALSIYDKTLMALDAISGSYSQIFSYYDSSVMDRILDEKNICEDFTTAIEKNQIQLYLQPIINENTNENGAEALCRWNHPYRGFMEAESFLPILAKGSLIYQLDEFMWDKAAQILHEWKIKGYVNSYISVNVSVKDFFYTDVYETFTNLVKKYDISPSSLHIEITEDIFKSDIAKNLLLSNKLQDFGFVITIDNFGSSYSSLNMLKNVEAKYVKINKSYFEQSYNQERGKVILDSIIKMTKLLGIECVGERVETEAHHAVLKSLGVDTFQGNYFSAPLAVDIFEKMFF